MNNDNTYYVYIYIRSKTSNSGIAGSPYYIGKGKNNRLFHSHTACGSHPPKDKKFILKVFENLSDNKAKRIEIFLIKVFGRIDLGTGCLRNLTDGGDGRKNYKYIVKKESIEKQLGWENLSWKIDYQIY